MKGAEGLRYLTILLYRCRTDYELSHSEITQFSSFCVLTCSYCCSTADASTPRYLQSVNRAVNGNTRTKPLSEKGKADRLAAAAAWNEKFYSHYDNDTVPQMYPFISKAAEQVAEAAAAVATAAQSLGEPKKQSPLQDLAAAAAAASDAAYAEKENTAEQAAAPSGQAVSK